MLFVGTKQSQDAVTEHATRDRDAIRRTAGSEACSLARISERIGYLHDLRRLKADGQLDLLPSKERIAMEAELELEANLGGVADMSASRTRSSSST